MADGVVVGKNQYSVDNENTGINFYAVHCQVIAHTILFNGIKCGSLHVSKYGCRQFWFNGKLPGALSPYR
jgi:hypothetical protein